MATSATSNATPGVGSASVTSSPSPSPSTQALAVPTLKVMRLQKPQLDMDNKSFNNGSSNLSTALCLPNAFGVIHVGETFTAYLGVINPSSTLNVEQVTLNAQLQTSTNEKWQLATKFETDQEGSTTSTTTPTTILPLQGMDTIVSHHLQHPGQHILRVEVGYATYVDDGTPTGGSTRQEIKTLRKFYRFQVSQPLEMITKVNRINDTSCYISLQLENCIQQALTISNVEIESPTGFTSQSIQSSKVTTKDKQDSNISSLSSVISGTKLFDGCTRLQPGEISSFLFQITSTNSKGIAVNDILGHVIVAWRKACGEFGRWVDTSKPIVCPPIPIDTIFNDNDKPDQYPFVVYGSGLSVDVAAMAAARIANTNHPTAFGNQRKNTTPTLDEMFPITVEPIHPPKQVTVGIPFQVELLLVNHSPNYVSIQLSFSNTSSNNAVICCGPNVVSIPDEIPGHGGTHSMTMRFLPLSAGIATVGQGCTISIVNEMSLPSSGRPLPHPPLFHVLVVQEKESKEEEREER